MPRIDNYDLYGDSYHSSEFYIFLFIGLAGLLIYFWIAGLCSSKNKTDYIGKSISGLFGSILVGFFGGIVCGIFGLFYWFFGFLKVMLGLDDDENTKDTGCIGCLVWLYRLIFFGGIIMLFVSLLAK